MIDEDLVAYITGLGTAAGSRVHVGNAPQGTTFPFVVIRRSGWSQPKTLSGVSLFTRDQFQVHVLHKGKTESGSGGYAEALPAALAIKSALHGFNGAMGDTTVRSSRSLTEPVDASEIDGDKVTRWLQLEFLIVH